MPFYEYECDSCKFYTELLQKVSDAPLKKCPSCGKNTMKKLVSAPVFRLKGDGWYETDFKSDKENKRNLAVDKEPEGDSDSKAAKSSSADTKAADAKSTTESRPAERKTPARASSSRASSGSRASSSSSRKAGASRPAASAKSRAKPAAKAKAKKRSRR